MKSAEVMSKELHFNQGNSAGGDLVFCTEETSIELSLNKNVICVLLMVQNLKTFALILHVLAPYTSDFICDPGLSGPTICVSNIATFLLEQRPSITGRNLHFNHIPQL